MNGNKNNGRKPRVAGLLHCCPDLREEKHGYQRSAAWRRRSQHGHHGLRTRRVHYRQEPRYRAWYRRPLALHSRIIGASLQTIVGGNITILTELCERTRNEAFDLMTQHAAQLGDNAVIGARYDATEVMQGVTEVLAYGTAVYVVPKPQ